jgi:Zn-dependent protease with chaperone function
MTGISYIYVLWATSPITPIISVPAAALFLVSSYWVRRHKEKRQVADAQESWSALPPRMRIKLEGWLAKLRGYAADESVLLVLQPSPSVLMRTIRSKRTAIVAMSAGFWATYQESPDLIDAAVAHEAGHVAARDVEQFLQLRYYMRVLAIMAVVTACWVIVSSQHWRLMLVTVAVVVLASLGVGLSWSGLLVARELQADVYATEVLGTNDAIRQLLLSQLAQRARDTRGLRDRLLNWLIQPDLKWRAELPGVAGMLGAGVELKLGLGFAASIAAGTAAVSLLSGFTGESPNSAEVSGFFTWMAFYAVVLAYMFLWGRSRDIGGRGIASLRKNLASLVRFGLPTSSCAKTRPIGLRGLAVIELEYAAEPRTAHDRACADQRGLGRDELVAQTLVRPLLMIMLDKRSYGSPEVPFAEWHDPLQALGLGGLNKPLGKRVQIWTPGRQDQWLHATAPQQAPKGIGVERVSVQDEVLSAA